MGILGTQPSINTYQINKQKDEILSDKRSISSRTLRRLHIRSAIKKPNIRSPGYNRLSSPAEGETKHENPTRVEHFLP